MASRLEEFSFHGQRGQGYLQSQWNCLQRSLVLITPTTLVITHGTFSVPDWGSENGHMTTAVLWERFGARGESLGRLWEESTLSQWSSLCFSLLRPSAAGTLWLPFTCTRPVLRTAESRTEQSSRELEVSNVNAAHSLPL